jgi:antitoxin component YwqK of YwqJK toxin-antitoxin module
MKIEIAPEPPFDLFVPEGSIRDSVLGLPVPPGCELLYLNDSVYSVEAGSAETLPLRHGPSVSFYPSGAMKEQGRYEENQRSGVWVGWHDGGGRSNVVCYEQGVFHGLYITYWPNGARQTEIQFASGKKHGTSKSWSDSGLPLALKRFEHGELLEHWAFREDGSATKL